MAMVFTNRLSIQDTTWAKKSSTTYNYWPADKFQSVSKPKSSADWEQSSKGVNSHWKHVETTGQVCMIGSSAIHPDQSVLKPRLPLLAAEVLLVFIVDSLQPRQGPNGQPTLRGVISIIKHR
jgi:hypothetical protein